MRIIVQMTITTTAKLDMTTMGINENFRIKGSKISIKEYK